MSKQDRKYNGRVGEHYVLYRLIRERKDINAAIAAVNTDTLDIYAADKAGKRFAVQVKTKTNSHRWQLDRRHEHIEDPGLFYAFVDLGWDFGNDFDVEKPKKNPLRIKDPPEVFIVPSERVARAVRDSHQAWRSILKKDGTPRKDGNQRDIFDTYPPRFGEVEGFPAGWMQPYRNNWGLRR